MNVLMGQKSDFYGIQRLKFFFLFFFGGGGGGGVEGKEINFGLRGLDCPSPNYYKLLQVMASFLTESSDPSLFMPDSVGDKAGKMIKSVPNILIGKDVS